MSESREELDPGCLLSASRLLELRRRSSKAYQRQGPKQSPFRTGVKYNGLPDGPQEEAEHEAKLEQLHEERLGLVGVERVKPAKDLGFGVWLTERRLVAVTKNKNKPEFMGFSEKGQLFLYPEEAIFLMESEAFQVFSEATGLSPVEPRVPCNGLPISLQEAYSVFFANEEEMDKFRVYGELLRHGYAVKRYKCTEKDDKIVSLGVASGGETPASSSSIFALKRENEEQHIAIDTKKAKHDPVGDNLLVEGLDMSTRIRQLTMSAIRHRETFFSPVDVCNRATAKNWKEYKEGRKQSDSQAKGFAVDLKDLNNNPNLVKLLATKLFAGDIRPIINPIETLTSRQIYDKLKSTAPGNFDSEKAISLNIRPSFKVYVTSKGINDREPDAVVTIFNANSFQLTFNDVISLNNATQNMLFAVIDEYNLNYYQFTPFECWDEFPELWKSEPFSSSTC